MNYAAALALLVMFTFLYPLILRASGELGLPQYLVGSTLIMLSVLGTALYVVHRLVNRHRRTALGLAQVQAQVQRDPDNPRAYFAGGAHLAEWLLRLGRRREAEEAIDRYARLPGARESEIAALREGLERARKG